MKDESECLDSSLLLPPSEVADIPLGPVDQLPHDWRRIHVGQRHRGQMAAGNPGGNQACSTGKTNVVAAYLDSGIDPNARDKYQLTGLMWAGRKGRIEVAGLLIKRGADIEAGDVRGRTALFHAVPYKRYEFVEFLAKLGANVSPIDLDDWTPLDIVTERPDLKMVALLESLGGIRKSTEGDEGVLTEISIGQQS